VFVQLLRDFLGKKASERLGVNDTEGRALVASGVAPAAEQHRSKQRVGSLLDTMSG
jgi:hypothetical protein